jgi:hypothetical protein
MTRVDLYRLQYVSPGNPHPKPRPDSFMGEAAWRTELVHKYQDLLDAALPAWRDVSRRDARTHRRSEGELRARAELLVELLTDLTGLEQHEIVGASKARAREEAAAGRRS